MGFTGNCKVCGKSLYSGNITGYCQVCLFESQYNQYIAQWKENNVDGMRGVYQISNHIHRYLKEKFNNQCSRCGWHEVNPYTNNIPLEVEHKDGNYLNNTEDNLDLLCPNCHSLTSTYKGANKGNGRKDRQKYS